MDRQPLSLNSIWEKIDKFIGKTITTDQVTKTPMPGKILLTDESGHLPTDITGNALSATNALSANNVNWDGITNKPNTLASYGIIDAAVKTFISVKEFGAKGDGVTDDTIAIQNTINYCITHNKTVYVPNGTYICTPITNHNVQAMYPSDFFNKFSLLINANLKIVGENEVTTIFKSKKLDGSNPDGSMIGYVGMLGILPTINTDGEIDISNITLDGCNTIIKKSYFIHHKAIHGWNASKFKVNMLKMKNVTIKNFEAEGASAANVSHCEANYCTFSGCGGSMGNISGNTKYYNCKFLDSSCAIEHANSINTGILEVVNCDFFNWENKNAAISVLNNYDPFNDDKLIYRTGTRTLIRGCNFKNTKDWIIATSYEPENMCSAISIAEVGTTVIENNTFTNSALGSIYGHGVLMIRAWNENLKFNNNTIITSDDFFQSCLSLNTLKSISTLEITNNNVVSEYPLDNLYNLFALSGSFIINNLVMFGNRMYTGNKCSFTNDYSTFFTLSLVLGMNYLLKTTVNVKNASKTCINLCDNTGKTFKPIVNAVLNPGTYTFYTNITTPTVPDRFINYFFLKGNGDIDSYFNTIITDSHDNIKKNETIDIYEFGAKGDGITDDTIAIQNAFNIAENGTTIIFPRGTYKCSSTLVLGSSKKNITIMGYGATLKFSNFSDGLNISSTKSEQNHIISGLKIQGPNNPYPTEDYIPPSTGAGINMDFCYGCIIKDINISGFNYGLYTANGISNVIDGYSYFWGNQYGIYIAPGIFNANTFKDVRIRENRKQGIHIEGNDIKYHVFNVFEHCLIESNKPYLLSTTLKEDEGIGIYISKAYDTQINNCYFENQEYYAYIYSRAYDTKFNNCYFSSNGKAVAYFNGKFISRTQFINCHHYSTNHDISSLKSIEKIIDTTLINCVGFNIISSELADSDIDLFRCKRQSDGIEDGTINLPSAAILVDPKEGTARGTIKGIGTVTATLYAQGYGDITFGNLVTANTTITTIDGLRKGQFLVLYKSITNNVSITIQSTPRYGKIVLQNNTNCILRSQGDMIVFWVNYAGNAIEIMRNLG